MSEIHTGTSTKARATRSTVTNTTAEHLFAGPGEMRERCRTLDWARTPLGPVDSWPASLRVLASTVLGSAFPMVLLWGESLVQIYNDGYRDLMGVKHPAGLGQPTQECWPEVWHLNAPTYERVRAGETIVLEDALFPVLRSGVREDAWFSLSYSPVPDESGGVAGALVTVFETTAQIHAHGAREEERERLLAAERASAAELRAVLESMADAVYIGGSEGITLANQAALDQLGFATREELNRSVGTLAEEIQTRDLLTGAFIPAERQAFSRALAGERVIQDVLVRHRTLGVDRVVRCAAAPVIVDERVVAAVAVNSDITEQKVAEKALRESEARFRTVQEASPYGLVLLRPERDAENDRRIVDFRIQYVNSAGARLTGKRADEMVGRTLTELFPSTRELGLFDAYVKVIESGESWEQDIRYVGDGLAAGYHLAAVRAGSGDSTELVLIFADATSRLAAEAERMQLLVESERARAEAETMRARNDAVLASIADAFYLLDREWRFTYVNDAAEPLLQSKRQQLLGRTLWEAFPGVIGSPFEAPYRKAMEKGCVTSAEAYFPPLGTWFDVRTYPWTGGLMVHFRDIGERKAAETERERLLRELEVERSRLSAVFAQTPSVLAIVRGPEHILELANEAYIALNGYRDVIGKPLLDAIPELRGQGFDRLLDEVVETGTPYIGREVPIWLSTTRGAAPEERFFDFVYLPLVENDASGMPQRVGVIAHGNDITEQVQARREVERARERADRLQAITAALAATTTPEEVAEVAVAQGVAVAQATTGVLTLPVGTRNAAWPGEAEIVRYHGASPDLVEQNTRFPLTRHGPAAECFRSGTTTFIEDGTELRARFPEVAHIFDSMGTKAVAAVPLTAAGEVIGAMAFSWNTPRQLPQEDRELFLALGQQTAQALERARLFEAERAARNEAEAANRAKSEFLAVMSHELRTPLNAIGGYAELMEMGIRGPVTPHQREDLRRVQASQRHLLGLINEVLNYAKLETGTVHFDVKPVQLRDALAEAEALVAPQARAKGLALTAELCEVDLAVEADAEKLRQILVNLLSNAVKFTASGGHVTLACAPTDTQVQVTVHDDGIGIPAEQQERIFDPFVQVRSDLTRPHEGTGLGLAISRDLARGMHGNLVVESAPGVGSTFTLTLPRVVVGG